MRFSFTPNAVIILFVIVGRCWHVNAALDHSVPEQPRDDRILQESEVGSACSNSCNNNVVSDLVASVVVDVDNQEEEEQQDYGEETGGVLGGLLGRLMNGFFKIFNRRQDDGPKYTVRTGSIIPLLEESSSKFKSLAELIKQESVTEAALSTTSDAMQKLYTAAADNMMLVATVLDPIVDDMRSKPTMDIRSISCDVTRVLTVIRDVTVPNIKLMAKLIHTKSNDVQTKYLINQYVDTSEIGSFTPSSAAITTLPRTTCAEVVVSSTTTASRQFTGEIGSIADIIKILFTADEELGPIGNIAAIIVLIIFFPISIVLSIVVTILVIIIAFFVVIIALLGGGSEGTNNDDVGELIVYFLIGLAIASPIVVIIKILVNIREFFTIDPRIPAPPTPSPTVSPAPRQTSGAQQVNEVRHHILDVLDSPLDTIIKVLGNKNSLYDSTDEEGDEIDCEMSSLKCKTDALSKLLPF